MIRKAFTFVELVIVVAILLIVTTVSVNAGVRGQRAAEFFGDFQNLVVLLQGARSQSLSEINDRYSGHGVEFSFESGIRKVIHFVDVNDNKKFDLPNSELLTEIDLTDTNIFWRGKAFSDKELATQIGNDLVNMTFFFPKNSFACEMIATKNAIETDAVFTEIAFTTSAQENFDLILAETPRQILSMHNFTCVPEVSHEPLL